MKKTIRWVEKWMIEKENIGEIALVYGREIHLLDIHIWSLHSHSLV